MAVHDVDKSSTDRGQPMPGSHDLHNQARSAAGTTSIHPTTDSTARGPRIGSKNGRLLIHDGVVNRGIVGLFPNGQIGIIISNPTVDVLTLF